jgi:DNA-binding CsgD family transcriptional regulator
MIGHNLTDTEFDVLCLAADGHTAGSTAQLSAAKARRR